LIQQAQIDAETAFAKINLALHVRTKRPDGYHEIDTIFAFLDCGDVLSVARCESLNLKIIGKFAEGLSSDEDNLVMQAARLMQRHFGIKQGAKITLEKHLPIASGIGGGSADAAATARLLNRFWDINASLDSLAQVMASLGADLPACVYSELSRGRGIGTDIEMLNDQTVKAMACLLVNPNTPLSTAAVFAACNKTDLGGLKGANVLEITANGRNDLELPAITICPEISAVLGALVIHKPVMVRMSGSGATCFAIFTHMHECASAARQIIKEHPDWWTMAGMLR
jgi:4-diphosphocytidyl-2-C-methyl-D-erythritol kinase